MTPFIVGWEATVDALESRPVRAPISAGRTISQALFRHRGKSHYPDDSALERIIYKMIDSRTITQRNDIYANLRDELVLNLVRLLADLPNSVDYLTPLVQNHGGTEPLSIATLNYDKTVETACELAGVKWSHGLDSWSSDGRLSWAPNDTRVIKLHGSIDWSMSDQEQQFAVGVDPQHNRSAALIFGRREKLQAAGPFLQLLEQFRSTLLDHDLLAVVGYSFRDDHINSVLHQWMTADHGRRIAIIDPRFPTNPGFPLPASHSFIARYERPRQPATRIAVFREPADEFFSRLTTWRASDLVHARLERGNA